MYLPRPRSTPCPSARSSASLTNPATSFHILETTACIYETTACSLAAVKHWASVQTVIVRTNVASTAATLSSKQKILMLCKSSPTFRTSLLAWITARGTLPAGSSLTTPLGTSTSTRACVPFRVSCLVHYSPANTAELASWTAGIVPDYAFSLPRLTPDW